MRLHELRYYFMAWENEIKKKVLTFSMLSIYEVEKKM